MSKDESKKAQWTPKYYRRYGRLMAKDKERVITIREVGNPGRGRRNKNNNVFFFFDEFTGAKKEEMKKFVALLHFEGKKIIIRADGKPYDKWYLAVHGPKKMLVVKPVTNDSWSIDNEGQLFVISSKFPLARYTGKGKNNNRLFCYAGKKYIRCGPASTDYAPVNVKKYMDPQQLGRRYGELEKHWPESIFNHFQYLKYWSTVDDKTEMKEVLEKAGKEWKDFDKWLEHETEKSVKDTENWLTVDTYWDTVKKQWDENTEKVKRIKQCMDKAKLARKFLDDEFPKIAENGKALLGKQVGAFETCTKAYESAQKGYASILKKTNKECEDLNNKFGEDIYSWVQEKDGCWGTKKIIKEKWAPWPKNLGEEKATDKKK